ncbi:MAG: ArnT family glycosyltransferase [Thermoanaerobaculia bacterium]
MTRPRFLIAIVLLILIAAVRVAATHHVFSTIIDEPAHLAGGMEWLAGKYRIDPSHPPLARVLGALPLWLRGDPMPEGRTMIGIGLEIVYHGEDYIRTMRLIRLPNLILLAIAIASTAAWARRAFSDVVAIIAAALFITLPPVLAHAGFLTTDLAALAAIPLFLYSLDLYLERPDIRRGMALGAGIGFGLLAKFSFLPFGLVSAIIVVLARSPRHFQWKSFMAAIGIAFLMVWSGYRFDFRKAIDYNGEQAVTIIRDGAPRPLQRLAEWVARKVPIPAPAFAAGLAMVAAHDRVGHPAYLLGEVKSTGWWYYFPVIFFYKTPLPFLLLAVWGCVFLMWDRERLRIAFVAVPLAILAVSMTSAINIGIRHILPMYAPLSIVAAYAVVRIWTHATDAFARTTLVALLAWLLINTTLAHPDYLAWFNEAAGSAPHRIAVDSNLDWGQDVLRLARMQQELQLEPLSIDISSSTRFQRHNLFPPPNLDANAPIHGWLAVSETVYALKRSQGAYGWLDQYRPVRRIGKSIRLYSLP